MLYRNTRPPDDDSYYNRKKVHSVLLQGICDADMRFMDVFCGFPGSAHDARVWTESPLGQALAADWQTMLPKDSHFLGDKAYPSLNYLVVPFKNDGQMTPQRKAFNKKLSKVRVKIEHAFGRLKGIFTRMKYLRRKFKVCQILYYFCMCSSQCRFGRKVPFKRPTV
nr:PREDICTED: putative nuclease HARBI1 [Bemisia tabaci]